MGQGTSDNKRLDKLEAWQITADNRTGTTENKVGNLETAFTGLEKMTDERHVATTEAIKGNNTKLNAILIMLATVLLGGLSTLIISLLTK